MRAQFFLVVVAMVWPVPARVGDVVVVREGARVPVSVVRRKGARWHVVYQADRSASDVRAAWHRGTLEEIPDAMPGARVS